jgi:hypothetical protein
MEEDQMEKARELDVNWETAILHKRNLMNKKALRTAPRLCKMVPD